MRFIIRSGIAAAAVSLFALGCSSGGGGGGGGGIVAPPNPPAALALQPVASGLSHPVLVTAPTGDSRLFIVEKAGRIRIVKSGTLLPTPFLSIESKVSTAFEQGLLGLAFDPGYASNGRFYVSLSNPSDQEELWRFQVSGNADVASSSGTLLLTIPHPTIVHYGGMLQFGSDGMLYFSVGDGGVDKDTPGNGQSTGDLLGNILRLDVRTGSIVAPPDNPFPPPARRELWSIGLRNPWRFSFDRATGDLYIGDVGEETYEEIDVAPFAAGRGRGVNFGWNTLEGLHCYSPSSGCSTAGLTPPQVEFTHGAANACCVIAGYVYRGSAIPGLRGTYFYSDFCGHWVRSFYYSAGAILDAREWPGLDPGDNVLSFGEDAAGELYICADGGDVYRIVQPSTVSAFARP